MGISALPWFPYERSQVMGGYLVLAIMLVYNGQHYFWSIIKSAFANQSTTNHPR